MMMFPVAIMAIADESDRIFMEQLYCDHEKLLYKRAYQILNSKADAEDAVNNACVALIKKIPLLRTLECNVLSSYIVSTIERVSINLFNKRKRDNLYTFGAEEDFINGMPSGDLVPDDRLIKDGDTEALYHAILKLPQRERSMMQMKYYDGLSNAEIAQVYGIKPDGVRVYLFRARGHLKEMLGGENDGK
ncbi:MAG: sigma-70 family RNA polymerase sigma factor [Clostridiales bacterium]|nr:sigma-70 family RNA polymerase sigma factor [Clostridiales bacterium]